MTSKLTGQVIVLHGKFGHPIGEEAAVPTEGRVRRRMKLIAEEFLELLEAATENDPKGVKQHVLAETRRNLYGVIDQAPVKVDLPKFVDALGDLQVVIEGTYVECGVDSEPVLDEIQRANLCKEPHPTDRGGKFIKPPGWTPPDIAGVLRRQGWRP